MIVRRKTLSSFLLTCKAHIHAKNEFTETYTRVKVCQNSFPESPAKASSTDLTTVLTNCYKAYMVTTMKMAFLLTLGLLFLAGCKTCTETTKMSEREQIEMKMGQDRLQQQDVAPAYYKTLFRHIP
jgi:hypothetical protein